MAKEAGNREGVGDGRPLTAPTVAGRARVGARTLGANLEDAKLVDPGD